MKKALAAAAWLEEIIRVLKRPVACVVSLDDDVKLPKGGGGWERYINRVRVFDRRIQDWADLETLASPQQ
ncbi:MAG TPA: hypothetical protein VF469_01710 [Kofleriaceae bacterium]